MPIAQRWRGLGALAVAGLILSACGTSSGGGPADATPAPTVTEATMATPTAPGNAEPSPTPAGPAGPDASPTPAAAAAPTGAPAVAIEVTSFSVAQNLEVRIQFTAQNTSAAAIQDLTATRLVLKNGEGQTVLDTSPQGGVMDMRPMAGLPAGMSRPYSYMAVRGPGTPSLTVNEAVSGLLTVRADGHDQVVALPATRVTPPRVP
ncbi:MAG TPA: hypothetical protein VKY74_13390 [Chloroflexia bacterium]|nr:hypothetical protein [Chloroflexia bacterium]